MSQIQKRKVVIIYEIDSFDKCRFNKQMQTDKMKRNHKMKEIKDMNKAELLNEISRLNAVQTSHKVTIAELELKLESSSKDGRKSQVLSLLREYQTISILEIASKLNISTKNVSSQLTYLRSDGYQIFTDPNGRKCLFEDKTNDTQSVNEDDSTDKDDSDVDDNPTTEDEPLLEDTL
jgi:biotin operon repressor